MCSYCDALNALSFHGSYAAPASAGPTALEAVCDLLSTVSDDGVQTCSVCGAPGNLRAGGLSEDQDSELELDGLYFEVWTSINWAERTIQLQKGMVGSGHYAL